MYLFRMLLDENPFLHRIFSAATDILSPDSVLVFDRMWLLLHSSALSRPVNIRRY